ncbi:GNAT family N-acetyltransferase [Nocardioides sp. zg-ZUI104]|uniref:GNAT family N-acetyltransferase n=1 Tax=Nocardioides faecalis TaxID=2803858 RepID=UPI001BD0F3E9|nr:GNAT family N-acetyltransferase [Nocardioides faecalis]MBS4752613.1 GNAT family N-acetyltransferase [Nocardioides faecalis]
MDDARRPPESGQHLLGPHVVGQRVVVRRVLRGRRGPSGGPAFTDLLGVCLSWADGFCVVQPEDGPAIEIALADIVSGKPVPPRPPVRHRVSAREAEAHTGALWPGLERVRLGDWELRSAPVLGARLVKRANSCLAMGEPGVPAPEAVAAVRAFYAARDRPPLAQVEPGTPAEEAFVAAGWQPVAGGDAELWLASVSRVRRALRARGVPARAPQVELEVSGEVAAASVGTGCDPLAEGRASVDGDWVGLHALSVEPAHRRRGLGTAVVGELLDWAAERGAMTAWLHVEVDNTPAQGLWRALGFSAHHACRYYAPPASAAPGSETTGSEAPSSASASPVSR